jgi:hypothetical protein
VQPLHATMDRLQQLDPTRLGDAGLVDILHEYERFVRRTPTPRHTLVREVGARGIPPSTAPGR